MTDEQISTTCLLEFLWLNRQICDTISKQTFDWLASLVEKSQQRLNLTPLHVSGNSITRSKPQTTMMSQPGSSTPTPLKRYLRHRKKRQTLTTTSLPHLPTEPRLSTTTTQPQLSTTTSRPQTTRTQLRQRKEYRMLTDKERDDYHQAINDLKKDTVSIKFKTDSK